MRIPSTQALRALDAFARHGTVWKAAEELHLTRSAVSHQLRLLERDLGFALFQRLGKGITLSSRGRRYAADVRRALTVIGDAGLPQGESGLGGMLTVSCTPGLASMWLCTRIAAFQEMHPDVALRIVTPRRLDDVGAPEVDLFVAFGEGNWPNRAVEPLQEVEFTPLCSPLLLDKVGSLTEPSDLFRAPLLHLGDFEDWTRWLALAGVGTLDPESGIVFSDMNLVLSAATAGQGFALGDELTCRQALGTGQLVRPFDLGIRSTKAYYLVMEHSKATSPLVGAFRAWLRSRLVQADGVMGTAHQEGRLAQ